MHGCKLLNLEGLTPAAIQLSALKVVLRRNTVVCQHNAKFRVPEVLQGSLQCNAIVYSGSVSVFKVVSVPVFLDLITTKSVPILELDGCGEGF